ncbi:hypothetical protein D3C71_1892020 [compost metagenome]
MGLALAAKSACACAAPGNPVTSIDDRDAAMTAYLALSFIVSKNFSIVVMLISPCLSGEWWFATVHSTSRRYGLRLPATRTPSRSPRGCP